MRTPEVFRVKIVSKRQVTIPQLLMTILNLVEGDELELKVEGAEITAVRRLKLVPANLLPAGIFSESVEKKLDERSRAMQHGAIAETRSQSATTTTLEKNRAEPATGVKAGTSEARRSAVARRS